jgi:hypothetical protein
VSQVATRKRRRRRARPYIQYSKRMAWRVTVFWMAYRLMTAIVVALRPDAQSALVDLVAGVDAVMMVNMGTYTGNSGVEKIAIALARRRSEEDEEENEDSNG